MLWYTRNKRAVLLALGGVAFLLLLQYAVIPLVRFERSLDGRIRAAVAQHRALGKELARYRAARGAWDEVEQRLQRRGQGFTLFGYLNQLNAKLGLQKNVDSIRPQKNEKPDGLVEENVEMRLRGVTTEQVVRLLYAVEVTNGTIAVSRMRLKRAGTEFDAEFLFVAATPRAG